jgi:tRNA (mo5U34)-methyltransferase
MGPYCKALRALKNRSQHSGLAWYPYESLMNFYPMEKLLSGEMHSLLQLAERRPILDLGCGDGDASFFLESLGCSVHAVDFPPTNFNQMRGVRALRELLRSDIEIHEADLDDRFTLPSPRYGLTLFCGILYHLKNPWYALETLARHSRYCILSTRVARTTADHAINFQHHPMAYLLAAGEANADSTNYWIFSETGLKRILDRCGWDMLGYTTTGATHNSDPSSPDADERAFCFLRSRLLDAR